MEKILEEAKNYLQFLNQQKDEMRKRLLEVSHTLDLAREDSALQ